ncbi:MAG: DUF1501 domain-containing protein [Planctomycetes bacterium]|nr:DUF1501 domain-containing protein [Planctomycetota bacterium]
MKQCTYACGSQEHLLSRRNFIGGVAAGTLGFAGMIHPASARQLHKEQKHVIVFYLDGGASQLETWDPKPGTDTGGPFQAIPTSVPGIHISELLPYTAKQMHRMALVRGINTAENDHGKGSIIMHTGRRPEPGLTYPHLGSVVAKLFGGEQNGLPGYLYISPRGGGGGFNKENAAFLGPRFASVTLADGKPPANLLRPDGLSEQSDHQRNDLRERMNQRFTKARRTAETEAYTHSFDQAAQLMKRKDLFDTSKEPASLRERYGNHEFGRHCLLARRLVEQGATCVKVSHSNYDTHHENFDFHIEQLGEFDRPFATLLEDLAERGLLQKTLVVVMAEFGRTPKINRNYGRDHWGTAWSVALAGCGIKGGAVIGKTNANGTAVVDRMVHGGHLFHTYFRALGLDPRKNHYVNQRPIPMADPKADAIQEVLA